MTLKYYLIAKTMHLKLKIPKLGLCSNFCNWQDCLRPINELIILNSQVLCENGCFMHLLLLRCWSSRTLRGSLFICKASPWMSHILTCGGYLCQETPLHQPRILMKQPQSTFSYFQVPFQWRTAGHEENVYFPTFQTQPEIHLHCHPKGPMAWPLSTNVFLSLLSPFKVVISDLCTVPVFPLWSLKLLEDRAMSYTFWHLYGPQRGSLNLVVINKWWVNIFNLTHTFI